jgi:hypothetical protein
MDSGGHFHDILIQFGHHIGRDQPQRDGGGGFHVVDRDRRETLVA